MNRRNFLGMIGGVAATAAVRTWPFRVYSFPSQPIMKSGIEIMDYHGRLFIYPNRVDRLNLARWGYSTFNRQAELFDFDGRKFRIYQG